MSIPRRAIHLIGALLVTVIFVTGTLLFAVPVYMQSIEIHGQRLAIANSNQQLVAEITELQQQKAQLPEIEKQLAGLRSQIPAIPQLDDVSALVIESATSAQVRVMKIDFAEPAAFEPRAEQAAGPVGTASAGTSTATDPSTLQEVPDGDAVADDSAAEPAGGQAQSTADTATSDRLQYPVTIEVTADSVDKLIRFLDELRDGPRLVQVTSATATADNGAETPPTLSVSGYTYIQLEPQGALR